MNKQLQFIFSILLLLFLKIGVSQPYPEWEQFMPTNSQIWHLKIMGDKLYCGTYNAGLIEYNMETGTTIQYTTYSAGLASHEISDVFVDNDGNIWLGHWESGVTKIQAGIGQVFNRDNSGLKCDSVSSIRIDQNNKVWIGTEKGLDVFDGDTWIHFDQSNSDLPSNIIRTIEIDHDNNKWIGCKNGFSIYNDTEWETHAPESLYFCNIDEIAIVNDSTAYLEVYVAGSRLLKFCNDTLESLNWPLHNCNRICDIVPDNMGNIWMPISGPDFSLAMYDGNDFKEYDYNDFIQFASNCFSIVIDDENNQWLGFDNIGLHKFDHTSFEKITDGIFSFKGGRELSIVEGDRLWVSAHDHYLDIWQEFDTGEWIDMNGSYGFYFEKVMGFEEFSNFDKVVAGEDEVIIFNENEWFLYNHSNSPLGGSDFNIRDILVDRNDILWIAEKGLHKYDGSWTSFNPGNSGMLIENVYSLASDSNGVIWMGGYEELASFDGQLFYLYDSLDVGIYFEEVNSICVDSSNTKWIGTSNGLIVFDEVNWGVFNTENSALPHINVTALQIDKTGNLWVGTGAGLAILNDGIWQNLDLSNSAIPERTIFDIEVAHDNTVWISYNGGIARYNQNGFLNVEEFPGQNVSSPQIKCFPNPFTEFTNFKITQPLNSNSELLIYDIQGKRVRTLNIKGNILWDGKDEHGREVNSGIYYCSLTPGKKHNIVKIVKQ